jgi:hypothetical protein
MSASYNPISREKEEGNRLGYYYNNDNLPYTKVDYLNIKNPKIVDAYGHNWNNIHEKKYYDISDKLDKIKDRISDDIFSSIDVVGPFDPRSNFNDIIAKIIHLHNSE